MFDVSSNRSSLSASLHSWTGALRRLRRRGAAVTSAPAQASRWSGVQDLEQRQLFAGSFTNADLDGLWNGADFDGRFAIEFDGMGDIVAGLREDADGSTADIQGLDYELGSQGNFVATVDIVGQELFNLLGDVNSNADALVSYDPQLTDDVFGVGVSVFNDLSNLEAGVAGTWTLLNESTRGNVTVQSNGTLSGSYTGADGNATVLNTSTIVVNGDGSVELTANITQAGETFTVELLGFVNTGMDVIVLTTSVLPNPDDADDAGTVVLVRRNATGYTRADLLGSIPFASDGLVGQAIFDGAGKIIGGLAIDNAGETFSVTGTYNLSSSGVFTSNLSLTPDDGPRITTAYTGALNASKNFLAFNPTTVPAEEAGITPFFAADAVLLEPVVQVAVNDAAAAESGVNASNTARFTVSRLGPTTDAITVPFLIGSTDNDAELGEDYRLFVGDVEVFDSVTIPAGARSVVVTVRPIDDTEVEGSAPEQIRVELQEDPLGNYVTVPGADLAQMTVTDNDKPIVSVDDPGDDAHEDPLDEGMFTLLRSGVTNGPLTVNFTLSGTATRTTDYVLRRDDPDTGDTITVNSITFADGEQSVDVYVVPVDDNLNDAGETVIITLGNNAAYTLDADATSSTVLIDDEEPKVAIEALNDVTESDAAGDDDDGVFRITRENSTGVLRVNFTRTGTATNNTDYTLRSEIDGVETPLASGTNFVEFPQGINEILLKVIPNNDTIAEADETVIISLSPSTNYGRLPASAELLILDDEQTVMVQATDDEASESGSPASDTGMFTITRSGLNLPAGTVVNFALGGATQASRGSDYTLRLDAPDGPTITGNSVTFTAADDDTLIIYVVPLDETTSPRAEPTENVTLTLRSTAAYSVDPDFASDNVEIFDNEPIVSIDALDDASETDPTGAGAGMFLITRDSTDGELRVNFTRSGSATNNTDYRLRSIIDGVTTDLTSSTNSILLPDGVDVAQIEVVPVDDTSAEPTEAVILTLATNTAYTRDPAATNATVQIQDNEPTLSVEAGEDDDASAAESGTPASDTATFVISRADDDATDTAVTANFTVSGPARRGSDYTLRLGAAGGPIVTANNVVIPQGQQSVTLYVVPIDETTSPRFEPTETVVLTLANNTAYNVDSADRMAMVEIEDNEPTLSVEAPDSVAAEGGDPANDTATFVISRADDDSTATAVTAIFTVSGNARRGSDYTLRLGAPNGAVVTVNSVVIPQGEQSVTLFVVPLEDAANEPAETVVLTLANNAAYALDTDDRTAMATINNLA